MIEDPLDGVQADQITRALVDYPEHAILKDDWLLIDTKGTVTPGRLVLALVDGKATVRPFEEGMKALGLVAAVVRRLP